MPVSASASVTELIAQWQEGLDVHERLMPLIYRDLRQIAGALFTRENPNQTLRPTALVTEAYLRLRRSGPWQSRAHFFGAAAHAMRQALIDAARRRKSLKRGGLFEMMPWDDALAQLPEQRKEILGVDLAIQRLSESRPRQARVIELRYFAGLDIRETAEVLNISPSTVRSDWTAAKAWLAEQLSNL